jgi:hypothetical protein
MNEQEQETGMAAKERIERTKPIAARRHRRNVTTDFTDFTDKDSSYCIMKDFEQEDAESAEFFSNSFICVHLRDLRARAFSSFRLGVLATWRLCVKRSFLSVESVKSVVQFLSSRVCRSGFFCGLLKCQIYE